MFQHFHLNEIFQKLKALQSARSDAIYTVVPVRGSTPEVVFCRVPWGNTFLWFLTAVTYGSKKLQHASAATLQQTALQAG